MKHFYKPFIKNLYYLSPDIQIIYKSNCYKVIALKDIKPNTLIMQDIPKYNLFGHRDIDKTIQMLYEMFKEGYDDKDILELYPRTVNYKINEKNNKYLINLIKCIESYPDVRVKTFLLKQNILILYQYYHKYLFNAFDMYGSPVLLFNGAKMNHSCDPNTYFLENSSLMDFITLKNIKKGDELTCSYLRNSKMGGREERIDYLLNHYNFICGCSSCK